jgi:hypothetical protein
MKIENENWKWKLESKIEKWDWDLGLEMGIFGLTMGIKYDTIHNINNIIYIYVLWI